MAGGICLRLAIPAIPATRFSFDLRDDDAPHAPLAIHWTRGLAADVSLRDFEESTVRRAYASFLERFDRLPPTDGGETP